MLYLLRHTKPNISKEICYGYSDIELHSDFYSEHLPNVLSKLSGIKLDGIKPVSLYTSPLTRCKSLANEISKELNVTDIRTNDLLMEMNFGQWELMSWKDIYELPSSKKWFDNYLYEPCPDGEAFIDLERRAKAFLDTLNDVQEDIIAVTHAGFIRAMMVVAGISSREKVFDIAVEYGDLVEINFKK